MLMYAWGSLFRYVLKGRRLIHCALSAALFLFSPRMESSIGFTKGIAGDAWKAHHSTLSSATAMGAALHQSNCRPGATIASTPEYIGVVNNCADWVELPFFFQATSPCSRGGDVECSTILSSARHFGTGGNKIKAFSMGRLWSRIDI